MPRPPKTEDRQRQIEIAVEVVDIGFQHIAVARHAKPGRMPLNVENHFGLGHFDIDC